MADRYQTLVSGRRTLVTATVVSTGVAEAGDIVALDAAGKLDISVLPTGVGPDVATILASENLSAGNYVNIYDNAGTANVRKADNSNSRDAHGYVLSSVTSGNNATVYFEGPNTGVSGRTPGARQFLNTSGAVTETPLDPTNIANAGKYHQFLGVAISATAINTDIDDLVVL